MGRCRAGRSRRSDRPAPPWRTPRPDRRRHAAARAQCVVVGDRSRAARRARRLAGLDQQRVDVVGRHVAVPVERARDHRRSGGHRLDQHDTERLAAAAMAHRTRRQPRSRANFSSSVIRPSHTNRSSTGRRAVSSAVSGPSLPIHNVDVRSIAIDGVDQDSQALALLVTAAEEHVGVEPSVPGHGVTDGSASSSTPLKSTS